MSETDATGFGKFVPGFDFLQKLAQAGGSGIPNLPPLASWVAPTLDVEEIDKRIGELKNVQFWLEQNSRALAATIQAMEVQKMTLSTLKSMNFNFGDLAQAMQDSMVPPAAQDAKPAAPPAQPRSKYTFDSAASAAETDSAGAADPQAQPDAADTAAPPGDAQTSTQAVKDAAQAAMASLVDPLQLWGSLTQQFQNIAATALKDTVVPMPAAAKPRRTARSDASPSKSAQGATQAHTTRSTPRTRAATSPSAKKATAKKATAKKATAKKAAAKTPAAKKTR